MSHFASVDFPSHFGTKGAFRTISHNAALGATTVYTVPTGGDGQYLIVASGRTRTVGTGASQTWDLDLTVNNGAANTTANFLAAIDALVAGSSKSGVLSAYLRGGDTVTFTTNSNGTVTTAAILDIEVSVVGA